MTAESSRARVPTPEGSPNRGQGLLVRPVGDAHQISQANDSVRWFCRMLRLSGEQSIDSAFSLQGCTDDVFAEQCPVDLPACEGAPVDVEPEADAPPPEVAAIKAEAVKKFVQQYKFKERTSFPDPYWQLGGFPGL